MNTSPSSVDEPSEPSDDFREVSIGEAFWVWCRVAALSFGGPAGQIAVMHRILIDERRWISEARFLHALNYCMLLPGPEAQQLATYIGWLLHGVRGGLMAGLLFILPGFVSILALSIVYACYQETTLVQGVFFGLKPAVLAIVIEALLRIGRRVLKNSILVSLAGAAFAAICFLDLPFPAVIAGAALAGLLGGRIAPHIFAAASPVHGSASDRIRDADSIRHGVSRTITVCVTCLVLWFGPVAFLAWRFGPQSVYTQEALFFSKAAVVTFGGAYAVLSYLAQQAVERYGWLGPGEMLDGLGMAETTPGPLIMVVQFVGFMGAYRNPGSLDPVVAGVLGSVITTWVTFVPCFFWIFLGAPYIERLRGQRWLSAAMAAITAAVVGVILNLTVWFAAHTLFDRVATETRFGIRLLIPDPASLDTLALGIAILAAVLIFRCRQGLAVTLTTCATLGAVLSYWRGG